MSGITPQLYTSRPETVEAIRVTDENIAAVAEWCSGYLDATPVIQIDDDERGYGGYAHVGDWVIRWPNGGFTVQPDQDDDWSAGFHDTWQPALPSTAQVTEYRFRPVPISDDRPDAFLWDVTVRRLWSHGGLRWTGEWEVTSIGWVLSEEGAWWPKDNAWPRCRFPSLDAAMAAADVAQWRLRIHGKTAADLLAERGPEDGGAPA